MARPSTRKVNLKDGYYIEVSNRLGGPAIKLHRDTHDDVMKLMKQHQKSKNVKFLGEAINGKFAKDKKSKARKSK